MASLVGVSSWEEGENLSFQCKIGCSFVSGSVLDKLCRKFKKSKKKVKQKTKKNLRGILGEVLRPPSALPPPSLCGMYVALMNVF